ncbi:MAG: Phosphatidylglycerophosphatase A [Candidatus Magnetoglobus multicellularis str. Araruama]|uniref:Phosphatidylglycerophosphatase A n=1 Tax=Candidatus Magnetoglobus multicellularis str. Araruama TaxID=890399 RepID=A0A1V1PDP7_9BACT|nr:MAG: Phosphatidylglycerophosphatase A [Candidatus Magnetoglobus multicellularis str. Araruama]
MPFAPGTWGTLVGLPLCYVLSFMSWPFQFMILIAFMPIAAWICGSGEIYLETKDPGAIVIDEIAGIMVTLAFLPFNYITVIAGFLLFRCFDIIKPFPISKAETYFQGGTAVLMDDIIAGLIARLILEILLRFV